MDWLLNLDWYWLVGIVLGLVLFIFLLTKYSWLRQIIRGLVVEAETSIKGSKMGQERFKYVVNVIHEYVPKWLKWYFTEARIASMIEKAVVWMKEKLSK